MGCDDRPQHVGSNSEARKRAQEAIQASFATREDELDDAAASLGMESTAQYIRRLIAERQAAQNRVTELSSELALLRGGITALADEWEGEFELAAYAADLRALLGGAGS